MKKTIRLLMVAVMATAMVTFTGCEEDDTAEWVDLGLPSGLLWASHNVGATNPEDYGDYFAWGETQPKSDYSWRTYRYCTVDAEGKLATLTKYNTSTYYGTVDNLTTLQSGNDAATVRLGNGARTPTDAEWHELLKNTTAEWTTLNGINGYKFTASNGRSIFLPAAGTYQGSDINNTGGMGYYWSSSLDTEYPNNVNDLLISPSFHTRMVGSRLYGFSVRAVRAGQN